MKKMRRLIPAVAMLMVAAVMLSTASFAWFTMNEQVTATGMQVQAQASGSMVIDDAPLTAISNGITVDFANLGSKKLSPVHYATSGDVTGWVVPKDGNTVDPFTGAYTGEMKNESVDPDTTTVTYEGQYVVKRTVWVGLAGDSLTKNIQVDLNCDVNVEIANAYAIAFFVNEDYTKPALILHVKDGKTAADRLLFDAPVAIPSTVGVAASQENPGVGIKITMYIYVDGNYVSDKVYTEQEPSYKEATGTAYDANATYYTLNDAGEYVLAAQTNVQVPENGKVPAEWNWYLFDKYVDGDEHPIYYVNNTYAPDAPSGLEVSFKLVDTSKTPAQPNP